jgi:hypothetical protein
MSRNSSGPSFMLRIHSTARSGTFSSTKKSLSANASAMMMSSAPNITADSLRTLGRCPAPILRWIASSTTSA